MSTAKPASTIDLNADVGEGYANDAALMRFISSANIACGGHAGDEATMAHTVRLARDLGVAIGAHPGFADRENFGRRAVALNDAAIVELVAEQVTLLQSIARREGEQVHHIKPHGALYNMAAIDDRIAEAVVTGCQQALPDAIIVGLADSALTRCAARHALAHWHEGFADRRYLGSGQLQPRDQRGAVIEESAQAAEQCVRLATSRAIATADGDWLQLRTDTLCLHGDHPNALENARFIHQRLTEYGVILHNIPRREN